MSTDIFFSVGSTANTKQEEFVQALEARLRSEGLNPNTVGRNTFASEAPLVTVEKLMDRCSGTVVLALERSYFPSGLEKRGGSNEKTLDETILATPWNQIEAAMSYSRGLPLLVIVDESVTHEGLLEPGYDWYVQSLTPVVENLNTPEFNGVLASWKEKIHSNAIKTKEIVDPERPASEKQKTIRERIENNLLVWFLGTLLAGFMAGIGTYEAVLRIAKLQVVPLSQNTDKLASKYWLKITNVSFDKPGGEVEGIRVHGHVGQTPIAYPIKTLWAQPNAGATSSPYILNITDQKVPLNLEVIAETKSGPLVVLVSNSNFLEVVDVSNPPITHEVRACATNSGLMATDGCVNIRIEIRNVIF